MRRQVRNVLSRHAGADARNALAVLVGRFRVEGYAFEVLATLVTGKAVGVEAKSCC